ncbi:MAG: Holliday junction branch migration protein RuvA [Patescibacteria group bacterium]
MIGYLSGKVIHKDTEKIIVSNNGIGYEVRVSARYSNQITSDEDVSLFVHTYVREDAIALYGFENIPSRDIFRSLISVSGVGPKTALGVLSKTSPEKIRTAVSNAETGIFTAISGIGKKTAGRIILDLQTVLGEEKELDFSGQPEKEDALEALENLGYSKKEAAAALEPVDADLSSEEQIKKALQNLAS